MIYVLYGVWELRLSHTLAVTSAVRYFNFSSSSGNAVYLLVALTRISWWVMRLSPYGCLPEMRLFHTLALPSHSLSGIFWTKILQWNVDSRINFSFILNESFCLTQAREVFSVFFVFLGCPLFWLSHFYTPPGVDFWVWCEIEVKNIFKNTDLWLFQHHP